MGSRACSISASTRLSVGKKSRSSPLSISQRCACSAIDHKNFCACSAVLIASICAETSARTGTISAEVAEAEEREVAAGDEAPEGSPEIEFDSTSDAEYVDETDDVPDDVTAAPRACGAVASRSDAAMRDSELGTAAFAGGAVGTAGSAGISSVRGSGAMRAAAPAPAPMELLKGFMEPPAEAPGEPAEGAEEAGAEGE